MQVALFIAILIGLVITLVKELIKPSLAFFCSIVILLIANIISPNEALSGFANPQLGVIILLLVVSDIFRRTAITDNVLGLLFKNTKSFRVFNLKMVSSVALLSAWLNNTPLVAVYLPYVHQWAVDHKISPSKVLMPLSFASILGGAITLIGTSTNLIVNGLLYDAGLPLFGFFEFALIGGVMLVLGWLYLIFVAPKLLPERLSMVDSFIEDDRSFFIETILKKDSNIKGKTVLEAGLRNLEGVFLFQIIRNEKVISPVGPNQILKEEDVLIFTGDKSKIQDLMQPQLGLTLPKECQIHWADSDNWYEAVVAPNASIVGKSVKDISFRGIYDGAILAIHRNGERIKGKLGDHIIKAGDVLLVIGGNDFVTRAKRENNFYLLSHHIEKAKPKLATLLLLGGCFAMSIILTFFGVSLFISLSLLLLLAHFFGLLDFKQLPKVIDFDLIFVIAFGLAMGKAFTSLNITSDIVDFVHNNSIQLPDFVVYLIIFLITNLMAAFITSKAAVAIVFPICLASSQAFGVPLMAVVLAMTFAAVANFLTPIGYQTNMMVYGPGEYKFKDFFKVGFPLVVLYMLVSSLLLTILY